MCVCAQAFSQHVPPNLQPCQLHSEGRNNSVPFSFSSALLRSLCFHKTYSFLLACFFFAFFLDLLLCFLLFHFYCRHFFPSFLCNSALPTLLFLPFCASVTLFLFCSCIHCLTPSHFSSSNPVYLFLLFCCDCQWPNLLHVFFVYTSRMLLWSAVAAIVVAAAVIVAEWSL